MNGSEKSDSAIRAMKPANNVGKPTAEWAEQRAGTKGNAGQPRTRRTQSRDRSEPDPVWWTPRSTKSVIHGRPVRSLATNRNRPAVGNAVPLIATMPESFGMTRRASSARILPV